MFACSIHVATATMYIPQISKALGDTPEAGEDIDLVERECATSPSGGLGNDAPRAARDNGVPPIVGRAANTCSGRGGISGATRTAATKSEVLPSARDVLKCLIRSNRRAYASRQEVASAMQEVEKAKEAGVETMAGVRRDEREKTEMGNGGEEGGDEEPDLISIKRDEARVISLIG